MSTDEKLPRPPPRMVCVSGGRGGLGKSVVAINLGVYLAQIGRSVVVADADPAGADLATSLGLDAAVDPTRATRPTPVPGLALLPAAADAGASGLRASTKAHMLARLRALPADYVIVDLGPAITHTALDLFASADLGILVTAPEPPAVEATYRLCRALFHRRLRRALTKERFRQRLAERAMRELPPLAPPPDVVAALARFDPGAAKIASAELARLHPRLVVNQVRLRTDLDLGQSLRAMAARYLGVDVDPLGHVEHDDAVWLGIRRRRPLLVDSPTSKSARNLERIARRVLTLLAAAEGETAPAPVLAPPSNHYETLGVGRSASDEEVRRAYKRQRELYAPDSLALTSLLFGDELSREQARIEEAHETLLDPVRRRSYDLSTFSEPEPPREAPAPRADDAAAAELAVLQAELAREIGPETEWTGALLRRVREAHGVDLADVAARTKVSASHFRAIEEEAYGELPALVYTRGFLQELAKYLHLDPSLVSRSYLKRMREAEAAAGKPLA